MMILTAVIAFMLGSLFGFFATIYELRRRSKKYIPQILELHERLNEVVSMAKLHTNDDSRPSIH